MARSARTLLVGLAVVGAGILLAALRVNPYVYFAGYVILQYVVIATAWNILGGYAGYVNFGTPAFFALGAYTAVFLIQSTRAPLPVLILAGGLVSALLGLGIGYLTLRLRGVFFSIATLALSIVLQTMIINWEYVGGSRGLSVIRPNGGPLGRMTLRPRDPPTYSQLMIIVCSTMDSASVAMEKKTPRRRSVR